jgi:hypothetical protein
MLLCSLPLFFIDYMLTTSFLIISKIIKVYEILITNLYNIMKLYCVYFFYKLRFYACLLAVRRASARQAALPYLVWARSAVSSRQLGRPSPILPISRGGSAILARARIRLWTLESCGLDLHIEGITHLSTLVWILRLHVLMRNKAQEPCFI